MLALGGAAYAALVAWDLSSAKFWATVGNLPAGVPVHMPAPAIWTRPERGPLGEILRGPPASAWCRTRRPRCWPTCARR